MTKQNSAKTKELSLSPYSKIKTELENSNQVFVDKDFPTKIESLVGIAA